MNELDTDEPLPDEDEFRELGSRPIPEIIAELMHVVLVNTCGAGSDALSVSQFMQWATSDAPGNEYRFCGIFGMAGKVWITEPRWYVTGPNPEEMLSRTNAEWLNGAERSANDLLDNLRAEYVAGRIR